MANSAGRLSYAFVRLTATRFLGSGFGRLVRFGVVGGASGLVQFVMLVVLKTFGLGSVLAYGLGLIVSLQFNFALNSLLVWSDRAVGVDRMGAIIRRWFTYHACMSLAIGLNFGIFVVAHGYMPDFFAWIVAILGSTLVKFFSLDRLAFKAEAA